MSVRMPASFLVSQNIHIVRLLYSEQGHPIYSGPSDPNKTERPISQPPILSAADQHHDYVGIILAIVWVSGISLVIRIFNFTDTTRY
jgi:hypothetical protein